MEQETNNQRTITVHGYEEHFAINPAVEILFNNAKLGSVEHHAATDITIENIGEAQIKFKCSVRSVICKIKPETTDIFLSFNKLSGSLNAVATDKAHLDEVVRVKNAKAAKNEKASKTIIMVLLLLAVLTLLFSGALILIISHVS